MRRTITLLCVLVAFLLTVPMAQGHLRWHRDPKNDAEVDDLIGVRLATFRDDAGVKMLKANAEFGPPLDELDECCYDVSFVFDSRGDGRRDYVLFMYWDRASASSAYLRRVGGRVLDADIGYAPCDPDVTCELLPVHFAMRYLHPTRHIRWYVKTPTDRAPDEGWFEH